MPMRALGGSDSLYFVLRREYGDASFTAYKLRRDWSVSNLLFDFGAVRIDTPLVFFGEADGIYPVRVSVAFKESTAFEDTAKGFAETRNLPIQLGDDEYIHPVYLSSGGRNWQFSNDQDVAGRFPELGMLYTLFLIEEKVNNIIADVEFMKSVAKEIMPYVSGSFQATLECFEQPHTENTGRVFRPHAKAKA